MKATFTFHPTDGPAQAVTVPDITDRDADGIRDTIANHPDWAIPLRCTVDAPDARNLQQRLFRAGRISDFTTTT